MDLGIRGKHAVVLGAAGGLGSAVASELAAEGAMLFLADRDENRLRDVAGELGTRFPVRIETQVCDLGSAESVAGLADRTERVLGQVDILFNNTGGPPAGALTAVDDKAWLGQFEAMVMGLVRLTNRVLPGMRQRKWGRILTSTSSGIVQPIPNLGISNTLRSALVAWSKTLATEVAADGVTVNVIVPGRIHTRRVSELDRLAAERQGKSVEDVVRESRATIPVGRYGAPEEFAALAVFLMSARASYITGATFRVDGGMIRSV